MFDKEKIPMTPEEEDKNAGVIRDEDGKVIPETSDEVLNNE